MESLKRVFLFIIVGLFLISFSSAAEWDNGGSYDEETRTFTFKNGCAFESGVCIGSTIGQAKLNTPLKNKVGLGYQKVAEFELSAKEDYNDILKSIEFYDMSKDDWENNKLLKNFDIKYKNIGVDEDGYEITIWEKVTPAILKKNEKVIVGIFTEVEVGDYVEWIPQIYGVEVEEWASYIYSNESFSTSSESSLTRGVTWDGTFLWVAGDGGNSVYKYNATGTYQSVSFSIASQDTQVRDVTWDGTHFWVVGEISSRAYKYNSAGTYTGTSFSISDTAPYGIVWDGTFFWIVGATTDTVYKYNSAGTYTGTSFSVSTQTTFPTGITWDGNDFWVSDIGTTVYQYNSTGTYTGVSFSISDGGDGGMTYIDDSIWITDTSANVYKYILPEIPPVVLQILPENNTDYIVSPQLIDFICYGSDALNFSSMEFYLDGILNETNNSGLNNTNYTFPRSLTDGNYNWSCTGENNQSVQTETDTRFLLIDGNVPVITIESPTGTLGYNFVGNNETLNVTFTDANLDSCWFNYNGTNITIVGCQSGVKNSTQFILEPNNLNMTLYANDSVGNMNAIEIEWEYIILQLNQTFEQNITEGELDDFSLLLDISDTSSLTDATFSYNGTNYTTTIAFSDGLYLISSMIVSPTVDEDTNFSFNFFFVVDGTNYSTAINEQLVINSLFSVCGGINNDTLLNMSLVDEETGVSISGTIEIIAEVVSKSSGITVETINNTFSNVKYGAICFTPSSAYSLYFLNTEIKYTSDGYVSELYYIQSSDMADYPRNLSLFSLNQTDSTEFVVTFQNDAFILVEGAVIQLQRKYIGEGVFKVVEAPITADGGKAIVHIDLNTNIYRISVVKDGVLLKFFDDIIFSCENELAGECTEKLRGDVDPNNDVPVEQLLDFAYSVTVSDENNTVNVLFAVPSGTPSSINVLLTQIDMFGNSTSCNTTVITSAGSITCDFSDTIEKSILQLTISKDGTQLAITNYGVDPELDMDGMNFFIVFLFLISLVGMAIASPEWMMIIGVMVFMISGTLLLLKGMSLAMGLGAMAWLVVVVIIIILKMAKQEDR